MIKDSLEQISLYKDSIPHWDAVAEIIDRKDLADLEPGRYEGKDGVYFMRANYQTREYAVDKFEFHKDFIDVQLILEGEEVIHNAPLGRTTPDGEGYSKEKDVEFGMALQFDSLFMAAGDFAVLFPGDAHNPNCTAGMTPADVKKVVIKVPAAG